MEFKEALQKLGIEDYAERIFSSNSHGELFHLEQYFTLAENLEGLENGWFRKWFEGIIKYAEEEWDRPASIYQHITTILIQAMETKE